VKREGSTAFRWRCPDGHEISALFSEVELEYPDVMFYCQVCDASYAPGHELRLRALHHLRTGKSVAVRNVTCLGKCGATLDIVYETRANGAVDIPQIVTCPSADCRHANHVYLPGRCVAVTLRERRLAMHL